MKKTFRVLGIIALVAIVGLSMAACDDSGGSGGGGGQTPGGGGGKGGYKIIITGVTDTSIVRHSILSVSSKDSVSYKTDIAEGIQNGSGTTITFELKSRQDGKWGQPWTEGGSYYLFIGPDDSDRDDYRYTNGAGDRTARKYNISSATSTIPFSLFDD